MVSFLGIILLAILKLLVLALDIVGFFLWVRVVTIHLCIQPLLVFDRIGTPLIDPLIAAVQRAIPTEWVGQEPQRARLATALTLLAAGMCLFVLNGMVHVLIVPG